MLNDCSLDEPFDTDLTQCFLNLIKKGKKEKTIILPVLSNKLINSLKFVFTKLKCRFFIF